MNEANLTNHISQRFNQEMNDVYKLVLEMGGLVEAQLDNATKALINCDVELAQLVMESDKEINDKDIEIQDLCVHVMATQQPIATDLRMLVSAMKVSTDLERIGDEAEKVARVVISSHKNSTAASACYTDLIHMAEVVKTMINATLDAFARMSVEDAITVIKSDSAVNREYDAVLRQTITYMMEDPRHISRIMNVSWAAKALERIADHSKNIAQYVVYLAQGEDIRYTKSEDL